MWLKTQRPRPAYVQNSDGWVWGSVLFAQRHSQMSSDLVKVLNVSPTLLLTTQFGCGDVMCVNYPKQGSIQVITTHASFHMLSNFLVLLFAYFFNSSKVWPLGFPTNGLIWIYLALPGGNTVEYAEKYRGHQTFQCLPLGLMIIFIKYYRNLFIDNTIFHPYMILSIFGVWWMEN